MAVRKDEGAAEGPVWHQLPVADLLRHLRTDGVGLTSGEARERLATTGPNVTPVDRRISNWRILADQLRSIIVVLLVAASFVAALTGDLADAAAIAAVLLLNVAIGFALESGAQRAVEALSRLEAHHATVVRDGAVQEIDARLVVPGDVVLVREGQAVPADSRLMEAKELRTLESALTGESLPVDKSDSIPLDPSASLPDRSNMVYLGTTIAAGTARALVVATGAATELGRIGALVRATEFQRTPLEKQLDNLGRQLAWIGISVGAATSLLAWSQQLPIGLVLQSGIALAVAAVPEGLPVVATITLALGVRRMARQRALIRRLPSVETLGSVTVICTDKTGTLTAGEMQTTRLRTLTREVEVSGDGYETHGVFLDAGRPILPVEDQELTTLLKIVAVVNRADVVQRGERWIAQGDPTEAALVVAARKAGIVPEAVRREMPPIGEIPFSSRRAFMATFHRAGAQGGIVAMVKGAPDVILDLCGSVLDRGISRPMRPSDRLALRDANDGMAASGLRVLAAASGPVQRASEAALRDLTFAGLAGLIDPPAPGVSETVRAFQQAGIRTVMLTGDQKGTAVAIARQLGLPVDDAAVMTGSEADRLTDDALDARLERTVVFSRVSPEAKLRIVAGLQRRGEIVAMLGDGVNDAAALKKADIGVTMGGRGTDVAREAAAVVLSDDRFTTIRGAIEQGRAAFENIQKFVLYLFSCNLAEIFVILGAGVAGLPPPLLPIQILWLNLITDTLPALSLAVEPASADVMHRPPARSTIVSGRLSRRILLYSLLVATPVFLGQWWSFASIASPGETMTIAFMVLALAQLLHLGNARDERPVLRAHRIVANTSALVAVVGSIGLQVATVTWGPLRSFLGLTELNVTNWIVVGALGLLPALAGQGLKVLRNFSHVR